MRRSFEWVFDDQAFRLEGVPGWEALATLGRRNLHRLVDLAQHRAIQATDLDRSERKELFETIAELRALAEASETTKPLLPRLRAGHPGAPGGRVRIYLGDTPGRSGAHWVEGTVVDVVKDFKAEWATTRDKGYYWRLTAELDDGTTVSYSSSEPRVLEEGDFAYLHDGGDAEFAEIYARNAHRDWQPVWCLERGVRADVSAMDLGRWLASARNAGRV